jgi:hypothetical protein
MPKAAKPVRRVRATRKIAKRKSVPSTVLSLGWWLEGYQAGVSNRPNQLPPKADPASWSAGWQEGYAHLRTGDVLRHAQMQPGADINLGGDYQGVGCVAWGNGFRVGIEFAARRAWRV